MRRRFSGVIVLGKVLVAWTRGQPAITKRTESVRPSRMMYVRPVKPFTPDPAVVLLLFLCRSGVSFSAILTAIVRAGFDVSMGHLALDLIGSAGDNASSLESRPGYVSLGPPSDIGAPRAQRRIHRRWNWPNAIQCSSAQVDHAAKITSHVFAFRRNALQPCQQWYD